MEIFAHKTTNNGRWSHNWLKVHTIANSLFLLKQQIKYKYLNVILVRYSRHWKVGSSNETIRCFHYSLTNKQGTLAIHYYNESQLDYCK